MIFKLLIVIFFISILYTLGSALLSLARGGSDSDERMVKSLTLRVVLSIGLFILLMLAYAAGLIKPSNPMLSSEKTEMQSKQQ